MKAASDDAWTEAPAWTSLMERAQRGPHITEHRLVSHMAAEPGRPHPSGPDGGMLFGTRAVTLS